MATITPNNTIGSTAITLQEVTASPYVVVGGDLNVAGKRVAVFSAKIGRIETDAFTAPVLIIIEGKFADGKYAPIYTLSSGITAAVTEVLTQTAAADQNVLEVASLTGFTAGLPIYINDATPANSEFNTVTLATVTAGDDTITLRTPLELQHLNTTDLWTQADIFAPVHINVEAYDAVRVVVDGSAALQTFAVKVLYNTYDDDTAA
jgi:hypothetical protein